MGTAESHRVTAQSRHQLQMSRATSKAGVPVPASAGVTADDTTWKWRSVVSRCALGQAYRRQNSNLTLLRSATNLTVCMRVIQGGRGLRVKRLKVLDPVESAKAAGLRYVSGEGPGIIRKRAGKGFTYIGTDGKPVRDKAVLQRIQSLVIPPAWESVWICPSESGHLQAVGRDAKGRKQYRYHPAYRAVRDETKFGRMLAFGNSLPSIRNRVQEDLKLSGLPKNKVLATIVKLLDETCIRIGNEEYAKSNESYGLTTMHDEHVDIRGSRMRFRFRGKSGQDHDIYLDDPRLAKIVKQCRDIPGYELFQYVTDEGEYAKVDSADVNAYLREITGEDFTAKDFRTWHGTGHTAQQLAVLGPAASDTEAKRNIVAAIKETAKVLGNRPATCRNYYVHPVVLDSYVEGDIFAVIQESCDQGALKAREVAVMVLVDRYRQKSREHAGVLARFFGSKKKAS